MDFNSIILYNTGNTTLAFEKIINSNKTSEKYGIILTPKDITKLLEAEKEALKNSSRIEFGTGIIDKLNFSFCDSPYVYLNGYEEVLEELIEIFYYLKTECFNIISDDDLIKQMRETFDNSHGSINLLHDRLLKKLHEEFKNKYED